MKNSREDLTAANLRQWQSNIVIQYKRCFLTVKINQCCIKQWDWMHKLILGDYLDCFPTGVSKLTWQRYLRKDILTELSSPVRQFVRRDSVDWKNPKLPVRVGCRYVKQISQKAERKKTIKHQFPTEFCTSWNYYLNVTFTPYKDSGHRFLSYNPTSITWKLNDLGEITFTSESSCINYF